MTKLINVGFGNAVNTDKVMAVVAPSAAPVKRMIAKAKETETAIDATQGRKTKSVIVLTDSRIVLSALQPETIIRRFNEPYSAETSCPTGASGGTMQAVGDEDEEGSMS